MYALARAFVGRAPRRNGIPRNCRHNGVPGNAGAAAAAVLRMLGQRAGFYGPVQQLVEAQLTAALDPVHLDITNESQ